jgi:UDP-GlcNAc3NAcA epimerase
MLDAVRQFGAAAEGHSDILQRLGTTAGAYALATLHRAENTDAPARLSAILDGLASAASRMPVLLPLHPRTKAAIAAAGISLDRAPGLRVIEPVGYLDMLVLERNARVIATDSGGVQKEAYFHGVPCVTLREETEWVELVNGGWNRLAPPTSAAAVAASILDAIADGAPAMPPDLSLYGDGHAAERIAGILAEA